MDTLRCPACSAALRPDAQWCSLCYLDLRPAPAPVPRTPVQLTAAPAAVPAAPGRPAPGVGAESNAAPDIEDAELVVPSAAAGWPCPDCSTLVSLDSDVCPTCGASFLARLAGSEGRHRSAAGPGVFARLPRTARLVVGTVFGLFLAVLVPVLLALFG